MTVTVVGFGAMGAAMARRLVKDGHAVTAVDPIPDARGLAAGSGIPAFADIGEVPRCDVVIVLVATGQQLLDAAKAAVAQRVVTGETWVISSTVGRRTAREADELLSAAGAAVIDAPVTGGVPGATNGTLRFLAGAPQDRIDSIATVLAPLGVVKVVGERPGDGQAMKVVNQLCSSVHLAVAAEAIALAAHLDLDPATVVDVISGGSGSSWFFDDRGPRMARFGATPEVLTRLAILVKDNGLVEEEADAYGARVPLLKAARRQYLRAVELGLLEADDSQIIQTYLD
ncbi:3-hydroxyisobutyrate dehydrogenase [Mycolicibacterium sp. BK556]|nr:MULTISPECIES: NAD(P)-dependent oxidoreductase [Mycobacteriaceae]MBB3606339.1 3-hydroxyisobutyrate dehydrogenase [Mycolicibacterium sp. BK556]MBB3636415.1 3-hydroxyisobutyrate dehydrogenase [Mycolicibacterium sp. BK607]TDO06562.1 3-hydroxyisobutyrate dehydrogenase [Mycobacterium sp. BK086]